MLPPKARRNATAIEEGGLVRERRQAEMEREQDAASSPTIEPTTSSTTQLLTRSPGAHTFSDSDSKNHPPVPSGRAGKIAPPGASAKVTTTFWKDEGCHCYEVEIRGVCVSRRDDNQMINGTKLLTLTDMTAGRKGALLKSEKIRAVVKIGPTQFKGVWISFESALRLANAEKIVELLYPLFMDDIGSFVLQISDQKLTPNIDTQPQFEEVKGTPGSSKARLAHSCVKKEEDEDSQPLALDTVQHVELQELGILGSLFRSLTETLGLIMKEFRSQSSDAGHYMSLESTCATLLFWGTDLGLPRGELDDVLQGSPQLRDTCLAVLVSISQFVSTSLIHLVVSAHHRKEILQSTDFATVLEQVTDMIGRQHDYAYQPEQDAETMCQTLRTKIDTLVMLAPSLESPAEEIFDEEKPRTIQDIGETLPEQAYASSVAEKFPFAPPQMVAQLGRLNWDRYNHILRLQREAMKQELEETTFEKAKTIFHDSGLGTSVPAQSDAGLNAEPVYEPSMMSSRAEASHKRVPPLPAQARSGEPFTCEICEKQVQFQRTRPWKKHVFEDILAYACFFPECHTTRVFFENGDGLMSHLQDQHGMDVRVSDVTCPLCVEFTSGDRDILSLHIARHMEEIALAILPSGVDSDEDSTNGSSDRSIARSDEDDVSSSKAEGNDNGSSSSPSEPGGMKNIKTSFHRHGRRYQKPSSDSSDIKITMGDPEPGGMKDIKQSFHRHGRRYQEQNSTQWATFEYSRNGVATEYTIRRDIETVDVERLPHGFKIDNCIFPRALVPKDQYKGNARDYEKSCNVIGWALAELNPSLQGRRGVLQKAVESAFAPSASSVPNASAIAQSPGLSTSASHLSSTVDPSQRLSPVRKKLNLSDYTNRKASIAQNQATKAAERDSEASSIAEPAKKTKIYGCPGDTGKCQEHRNRQWRSKMEFWTHFETHLQDYVTPDGYQCLNCLKRKSSQNAASAATERYSHGRELAMHIWDAHMVSYDSSE